MSRGSTVTSRFRWTPSPARLPRCAQTGVLVLLVAYCVFAASTVLRSHPGYQAALDNYLYSSVTMGAAVLILLRGIGVRTERAAWTVLGAGTLLFALGDQVYAALGTDAPASAADAFYLAFYPCGYAGLMLLVRSKMLRIPRALWLDGITSGLALAAVAGTLAFGQTLQHDTGSAIDFIVNLSYPLADLILVGVTVGIMVILGWRSDRRIWILTVGFALFTVADGLYLWQTGRGDYVQGTPLDALWPGALVSIAIAAWLPTRSATEEKPSGRGVLIAPVLCSVIAIVVLLLATWFVLPTAAVVLAAATLIAVSFRLALTFREVSDLAGSVALGMVDELTGLANRRALLGWTEEAVRRHSDRSENPSLALLIIDLDRFKEINDSLGHAVGDSLLRQVSRRLQAETRTGDTLARLGGDEFALALADGTDAVAAEAVARRILSRMSDPFGLDDVTLHVQAKVGIAVWPDHCDNPTDLLRRADVAATAAKQHREHWAIYSADNDPNSRARLQTVEELRSGIATGELVCFYQPKITIATGNVDSVEALVRWQHPTRGLLFPDEFLPLAEQSGLMRNLTLAVVDHALAQTRRWLDDGRRLTVAVNLSVTNLLDVDLPEDVGRMLARHRLPSSALTLEITETVLMADSTRAKAVVDALHQMGIKISIDDYGTGYSSLAYLQDLSADELKLDRAFVARLSSDPRSAAIVRSTVELAHSLGLTIVAEGVEDAETLSQLAHFGCDVSQGYFHSRPVAAPVLSAWLAERAGTIVPEAIRTAALRPGIAGLAEA